MGKGKREKVVSVPQIIYLHSAISNINTHSPPPLFHSLVSQKTHLPSTSQPCIYLSSFWEFYLLLTVRKVPQSCLSFGKQKFQRKNTNLKEWGNVRLTSCCSLAIGKRNEDHEWAKENLYSGVLEKEEQELLLHLCFVLLWNKTQTFLYLLVFQSGISEHCQQWHCLRSSMTF